jgi:hypothetical protein
MEVGKSLRSSIGTASKALTEVPVIVGGERPMEVGKSLKVI